MDRKLKSRQQKVRRAAARQGFSLVKSRTRDPLSRSFDLWIVTFADSGQVLPYMEDGLTLEQVEYGIYEGEFREMYMADMLD